MKEGWKYVKLEEVCNPTKNIKWETADCPHKYIDLSSVDRESSIISNTEVVSKDNAPSRAKQIVLKGDIIFATTRPTLRRVAEIDDKYDNEICSTGFCVLRPKKELLDTRYLYNLLKCDRFYSYIEPLQTGASYPAVTDKIVKKYEFPLPPLSEQQRIVEHLDTSFAKVDALKANSAKAVEEAKALFAASLQEAMTPKEGWEEKTLGEISIDMYRGSGIKRDQVTDNGISCVRYGEIYTTYNIAFEKCVSHTNEALIRPAKYFEHGDLLFAITGESVEEIGKSIAYLGNERCLAGGDMIVMKHKQDPTFLSYALSTKEAIRQKGRGKTKLKVVHTNADSLKQVIIPIPPLPEQQRIVAHLDNLSAKVRQLEANFKKVCEECDALKQAILRETFE